MRYTVEVVLQRKYHVEQCCDDASLHFQEIMFLTNLNTPVMIILNSEIAYSLSLSSTYQGNIIDSCASLQTGFALLCIYGFHAS